MSKQKFIVTFNKITGVRTGQFSWHEGMEVDKVIRTKFHDYKIVELDPKKEEYVGTLQDGKVVSKKELPQPIPEEYIDTTCKSKILTRYPVGKQINIIRKVVHKLAAAANLSGEEMDELNLMVEFIDTTLANNAERKEFYNSNPEYHYVSKEDEKARLSKVMEGGLHEVQGRQIDLRSAEWI